MLTFEPGFLLTPDIQSWATAHIADLEVRAAGKGVHFVQEEQPQAIADGVVDLLARAGDVR